MAFSDFKTIPEVQERFRIRYASHDFFAVETQNPSEQFLQELEFSRQYIDVFASEGSRTVHVKRSNIYERTATEYTHHHNRSAADR